MAPKKTSLSLPTGPRMVKGLRALADSLEGAILSASQYAEAEYARGKLVEMLGQEWAMTMPADRVARILGKQTTQLSTFANAGITSITKRPIDLNAVLREAFTTIQTHRKVIDWSRAGGDVTAVLGEIEQLRKERDQLSEQIDRLESNGDLFDDDEESTAPTSQYDIAKTRRMEAMAAATELTLREKAGELVRACDIEPILTTVADRIRDAGNTIGIQYGPEAQRIVTGAIDETERQLKELRRSLHTSEAE